MDKAADAWLGRIPNLLTLAVALYAAYGVSFRLGVVEDKIKEFAKADMTAASIDNLGKSMDQWRDEFARQMKDTNEKQDRNYDKILLLIEKIDEKTEKRLNSIEGKPQSMLFPPPWYVGGDW